jgi:hypothetical protein
MQGIPTKGKVSIQFTSLARLPRLYFKGRFLALPANIKLGWE